MLDDAAKHGGRTGMVRKRQQRRREGLRHAQAHAGEIDGDRQGKTEPRPRQQSYRREHSKAAGGHRHRAEADGAIEPEAHDEGAAIEVPSRNRPPSANTRPKANGESP